MHADMVLGVSYWLWKEQGVKLKFLLLYSEGKEQLQELLPVSQCNFIVDSHHVIRQLIKMTFCIVCRQSSVPGAVALNDNIFIRVGSVTDICKSQRGARKSDPCTGVLAEMF